MDIHLLGDNMKKPCETLEKIDFIDFCPDDGRMIYGTVHYSDKENKFIGYFEQNKKLIPVNIEPVTGTYWSKEPVDSQFDCYFKIINLILNNYSFTNPKKTKNIITHFNGLSNDITNFGTLINKQFILWEHIKNSRKPSRLSNIYVTELEYFMGLVRSFFDIIYNIIVSLYTQFKPKLPFTFPPTLNKFYGRRKKNNYEISEYFSNFFNDIESLFRLCKNIRDGIYHRGEKPQIIFITEKGPGISMQKIEGLINGPFSDFQDFFEDDPKFRDHLLKNDIASIFYLINRIIQFALESTNKLADAIEDTFNKPQSISNEYKVFFRAHEVQYLNKIDEYLHQCWIEP